MVAVTDEQSDQFVPEADRIATFDNDGSLWVEQPISAGLLRPPRSRMAPEHPEWQTVQPYAAILATTRR